MYHDVNADSRRHLIISHANILCSFGEIREYRQILMAHSERLG